MFRANLVGLSSLFAFHGTGGPRDLIDKIFAEGLTAHSSRWAHDTTGIDEHVFACTSPIGGRGGDPIYFAQRRTYGKDARAWLLVLDVPRVLVRGAVPNHELEQYWKAGAFAASAFGAATTNTLALIAHRRARRVDTRDLLDLEVTRTAEGLTEGSPDAHTLVQFEDAYLRARTRPDKARVAASYGLHLPATWSDDPHYPFCAGCMHQLFEVSIVARDVPMRTSLAPDAVPGPPATLSFHRGSFDRLDLTVFAQYVDALDRWLAAHGDPRVPEKLTSLQTKYPPPRDRVPRSLWPDFVTHDLDARIREPDTQILLGPVAPAHILGALDLGTSSTLSALVRPKRGETLHDKLWYLARQLAKQRASSDRPIVVT